MAYNSIPYYMYWVKLRHKFMWLPRQIEATIAFAKGSKNQNNIACRALYQQWFWQAFYLKEIDSNYCDELVLVINANESDTA